MKTPNLKLTVLSFFLALISITHLSAQNGTACYKPFINTGKVARPVQGSVVCVNCGFINNINNAIDNSVDNFAEFNNIAGLLADDGIAVTDTISTYPAGWLAGYVVDLGPATLLSANVLSAFRISTYNNGIQQETRISSNGLAVATVAGTSQRKVYLNFTTTLPFDEIRFTLTGVVNAISTIRVYYATAFDPQCGTMDNNNACDDQLAGSKTVVTFNGGTASALTTISNPEFITDGNKRTAAIVTVPAGLLTSPPYVGILDEQRVYPAGQKANFAITYPSSLLTAGVLNAFRIQTYLFGVLQEEASTGTSLLSVTALGIGNNNKMLSFVTTKKFNEVRLVLAQTAAVNIGTIGIDYASEEPPTCNTCDNTVGAGQPGVYAATINNTRTSTNGSFCLTIPVTGPPATLTNAARVVDSDITNYATYNFPLAGSGCGFDLSVKMADTVHRKSFVGFVVEQTGGLATVNLLSNITITTYRNNVLKSTSNASNLVNLGALSLLNAGKYKVGFVSDSAFDEAVISFTTADLGVSVGGEFRTYYPFIIRDDDGDGVQDCKEICGMAGDDGVDTDGDGTPDACDNGLETPLNLRVLLQGALLNPIPLEKDLMRYDLNLGGYIPTQQPYSATLSPRFTHVGGGGSEVVKPAVLGRQNISATILVDWVLVEIRSSSNPATIVKTVSALVSRNGEIVDTLGGPLMVSLPAENYYISVKHRNHLGIMTATASATAGITNTIDFATLTPAQVYGNGSVARIQILPGVYALWAGDVNSDGKVKYQGPDSDTNPVLTAAFFAAGNTTRSYNYDNLFSYIRSDVDLSGKAKYQGPDSDVNFILSNIFFFSGNFPARSYNYDFLTEQIP